MNRTINGKAPAEILKLLESPFESRFYEKNYAGYYSVNIQRYFDRLDEVVGCFNYNVETVGTQINKYGVLKTVRLTIMYDDGTVAKSVTGDGGAMFVIPKKTDNKSFKDNDNINDDNCSKPSGMDNTNEAAFQDAVKRACKRIRLGLDVYYMNRKKNGKANADEQLKSLHSNYKPSTTVDMTNQNVPSGLVSEFKLFFRSKLEPGSRHSYKAIVSDQNNNTYTLIIWENKVKELKDRGIFDQLYKVSELLEKVRITGTYNLYGPNLEPQIVFEEVCYG